jgi:hypothetical protein
VDITTQVIGVTGENKQTRNGPAVIYKVTFADGTVASTWDAALASKAQGFISRSVDARVETKQNGKYTNTYLNDIAEPGQLPATSAPQASTTIPVQGNGAASPSSPVPIPVAPAGSGMDPAREAKIVKQSLLSTSLNFVGQLYSGAGPEAQSEALEAGLTIAKALYAEVMGGQAPAPAPTPQAVAAAVPGVSVGTEDLKTW